MWCYRWVIFMFQWSSACGSVLSVHTRIGSVSVRTSQPRLGTGREAPFPGENSSLVLGIKARHRGWLCQCSRLRGIIKTNPGNSYTGRTKRIWKSEMPLAKFMSTIPLLGCYSQTAELLMLHLGPEKSFSPHQKLTNLISSLVLGTLHIPALQIKSREI